MEFPDRKCWRKVRRGLLSLSVLLGICGMLFPLPLAPLHTNSPTKDLSEPFPCQNRPCGCQSAKQCWKKCCCFTDTQKLAWAKANHVKVPDFVRIAAERASASGLKSQVVSTESPVEKSRVDPAAAEESFGDQVAAVSVVPKCCEKAKSPATCSHGSCEKCHQKSVRIQEKEAASKWGIAVFAAECVGQGPFSYCLSVTVIFDTPKLTATSRALCETLQVTSERLPHASLRPPLPPPKIV